MNKVPEEGGDDDVERRLQAALAALEGTRLRLNRSRRVEMNQRWKYVMLELKLSRSAGPPDDETLSTMRGMAAAAAALSMHNLLEIDMIESDLNSCRDRIMSNLTIARAQRELKRKEAARSHRCLRSKAFATDTAGSCRDDTWVLEWLLVHDFSSTCLDLVVDVMLPDSTQIEDMSALGFAALSGELEVCAFLLKHGADPRAQSSGGKSIFLLACMGGRLAVVKLLGEAGARFDISQPDKYKATPLSKAARYGHLDVAKWVVAHGASGDVAGGGLFKQSPLLEACRAEQRGCAMARWLLQTGAEADLLTAATIFAVAESTFGGVNAAAAGPGTLGALVGNPADAETSVSSAGLELSFEHEELSDDEQDAEQLIENDDPSHIWAGVLAEVGYEAMVDVDAPDAADAADAPDVVAHEGEETDVDDDNGNDDDDDLDDDSYSDFQDDAAWLNFLGNLVSSVMPSTIAVRNSNFDVCCLLAVHYGVWDDSDGHISPGKVRFGLRKSTISTLDEIRRHLDDILNSNAGFVMLLKGFEAGREPSCILLLLNLGQSSSAGIKWHIATFAGVPWGRPLRRARELRRVIDLLCDGLKKSGETTIN